MQVAHNRSCQVPVLELMSLVCTLDWREQHRATLRSPKFAAFQLVAASPAAEGVRL